MEFYLIPASKYAELNIDNLAKDKKIKIKSRKNNSEDLILIHCEVADKLKISNETLSKFSKVGKSFFKDNKDWNREPLCISEDL